jgi:hypothetical protein
MIVSIYTIYRISSCSPIYLRVSAYLPTICRSFFLFILSVYPSSHSPIHPSSQPAGSGGTGQRRVASSGVVKPNRRAVKSRLHRADWSNHVAGSNRADWSKHAQRSNRRPAKSRRLVKARPMVKSQTGQIARTGQITPNGQIAGWSNRGAGRTSTLCAYTSPWHTPAAWIAASPCASVCDVA